MNETIERIGDRSFAVCKSLQELYQSPRLTHIGKAAFVECRNLSKVTWSDQLEEIGQEAFMDCIKLQTPQEMGGVRMGKNAFKNCR